MCYAAVDSQNRAVTSKWSPAITCGIDFVSGGRVEKFGGTMKRLFAGG